MSLAHTGSEVVSPLPVFYAHGYVPLALLPPSTRRRPLLASWACVALSGRRIGGRQALWP
eukprot:4305404-Pyramimonas_sp.AAC.1